MERGGVRPGEMTITPDPAALPGDATVVFIGRVRTPWRALADCPKNVRVARDAGAAALLEIEPAYRPGLAGLQQVRDQKEAEVERAHCVSKHGS